MVVLLQIVEWKSDGGANLAGIITYLFGAAIWVTALPPVRKRNFQLFFYTHHLYVMFIIFLALHIGDTNFSKIVGGVFLFMLDRFLRFFQSRRDVDVISATNFPCGTVGLVISKPKSMNLLLIFVLRLLDLCASPNILYSSIFLLFSSLFQYCITMLLALSSFGCEKYRSCNGTPSVFHRVHSMENTIFPS